MFREFWHASALLRFSARFSEKCKVAAANALSWRIRLRGAYAPQASLRATRELRFQGRVFLPLVSRRHSRATSYWIDSDSTVPEVD